MNNKIVIPDIGPEVSKFVAIAAVSIIDKIGKIIHTIANDTGIKKSHIELELYSLTLCACVFGLVCEVTEEDIPVLNLVVNELQNPAPQPSNN